MTCVGGFRSLTGRRTERKREKNESGKVAPPKLAVFWPSRSPGKKVSGEHGGALKSSKLQGYGYFTAVQPTVMAIHLPGDGC